jgi:CheY-like chemotaxis protein
MQSEHPVVLIAERDPSVRELQRYFLGEAGYTVEFVDDGVAALERAQRIPPTPRARRSTC